MCTLLQSLLMRRRIALPAAAKLILPNRSPMAIPFVQASEVSDLLVEALSASGAAAEARDQQQKAVEARSQVNLMHVNTSWRLNAICGFSSEYR